jgi:predicted nucleic acid-binding protein
MSPYVLDSSILIAHLKGIPPATKLVRESVEAGEALASVLSRVEIEGGMRSAVRSPVARLMGVLDLISVTDEIARRAGEHLRRYRRSHQGIDVVDYVIAATAEVTDAELVTLNVEHFPMFPTLHPPF